MATLMRFSGIFYEWGYVRAAATISLGMLLAKAPKIEIKKRWLIWVLLIPVQIACLSVVCFHLGNVEWFGGFMGVEFILDNLLYPALIYLTFNVNVSSRALNYLGSLSFGLYAFQCPADLLRLVGLGNRYILLFIIVALTITEDVIKRIYKSRKISVSA
jgi:peptidoglycan/LPS O-acetylase OafA/YrhL